MTGPGSCLRESSRKDGSEGGGLGNTDNRVEAGGRSVDVDSSMENGGTIR